VSVEAKIQRVGLAVISVSIVLIAAASASSEIEMAVSPDQKFTIKLGDCNDFGCKVELKNAVNAEVLASIDVEAFDRDDSHCQISAHWRDDSATVALNIENGRSITECVVFVLANGKWHRLEFPEADMKKLSD